MKTNGVIIMVDDCHVATGDFNRGEHLRVKIEVGKWQTISCELPNGKFVTFAFVPTEGNEMECVDIHSTINGPHPRPDGRKNAYHHHLIGFTTGSDTFDSRKSTKPTTLATLLLNSKHYEQKDSGSTGASVQSTNGSAAPTTAIIRTS